MENKPQLLMLLTQLMRLHQITCGHFTADDGSTQRIPNNRVSELMDILEETEGKAIIWAHYQWDIKDIIKEIVKEYGPGVRGRLLWTHATK